MEVIGGNSSFSRFPQCGHPPSFLKDDFSLEERVLQVHQLVEKASLHLLWSLFPGVCPCAVTPVSHKRMSLNQALPDRPSPSITAPSLPISSSSALLCPSF